MLIAADSPIIDNAQRGRTYQPQPPYDLPSLPENLSKAGLSWKSYGDGFNYCSYIKNLKGNSNTVHWKNFDSDVDARNLPCVSWLYAPFHDKDLSEHPPYEENHSIENSTIKEGMEWTVERVNKVAQSDYWKSCAIFIVWDDWGGWYDHVEPPFKDTWEGGSVKYGTPYKGTQFSYGPRVPCLILSPYAKRGINKNFHSHVSIVKFCETIFGLGPLNGRDAASDDMGDCFDFTQIPLLPLQF
jgi:phospholipase C